MLIYFLKFKHINRENVDYSKLASRNNDDLNSNESRLNLDTTSTSQV